MNANGDRKQTCGFSEAGERNWVYRPAEHLNRMSWSGRKITSFFRIIDAVKRISTIL